VREPPDQSLAAAELWKSDVPAVFNVWCGNHRHRLAKVYDTGSNLLLVIPQSKVQSQRMELGTKDHGVEDTYLAAAMWELPGPPDGNTHGRCHCGLYGINFRRINEALAAGIEEMLAEWTFNPQLRRGEP
jgi:hypothetical protein